MSLSSRCVSRGAADGAGRAGDAAARLAALPAMMPRDVDSACELERAKADSEPRVAERRRCERCGKSKKHEERADDPDRRNAERAAGEYTGAVEKQPYRRHGRECAR